MNTLSARENFHRTHDEKQRSDLSALVNSTPVKTLMIYAMAQMAQNGYSKEALMGANAFQFTILNLADPAVPVAEFKPTELDPVPTKDGR